VSGTNAGVRPRIVWSAVIVAALLIVGVVWAVIATSGGQTAAGASPSATPPPPIATEFPTPTPGATADVPSVAPVEVGIDQPATPSETLVARVVSLERFEFTGSLPGDVAGPALRVTVEVTNTGTEPVDATGATVTTEFGSDRIPGSETSDAETAPLPAMIPPGESVTAVGSFAIPDGQDSSVRIVLDLLAGNPAVVFEGSVPQS
jgi:hypothetical protein